MNITFKQASYAILLTIIVLGVVYSVYNFGGQNQPPPPKNYKIGFLALSDKDVQSENYMAFKESMKKLGYEEGKNVEYIIKQGDKNIKGDL